MSVPELSKMGLIRISPFAWGDTGQRDGSNRQFSKPEASNTEVFTNQYNRALL